MTSEKKCPACGQWTHWNHQVTDTCGHCGENLDKRTITEFQNFEEAQKKRDENSFFVPKPGENFLLAAFRRTAWVVHVVYMSIVTFILWVLAWLAG